MIENLSSRNKYYLIFKFSRKAAMIKLAKCPWNHSNYCCCCLKYKATSKFKNTILIHIIIQYFDWF